LAIYAGSSRQLDVAEPLELVLLDPIEHYFELVLNIEACLGVPDLDTDRNNISLVVYSEALDRVDVVRQLYELHLLRLERAEGDVSSYRIHDDHLAKLVGLNDFWCRVAIAHGQILEPAEIVLLPTISFAFLILVREHALHVQEHVDMPANCRLRALCHIAFPRIGLTAEASEGVHELERQPVLALEVLDLLAFHPELFLLLLPQPLLLFLPGLLQRPLLLPLPIPDNSILFFFLFGSDRIRLAALPRRSLRILLLRPGC